MSLKENICLILFRIMFWQKETTVPLRKLFCSFTGSISVPSKRAGHLGKCSWEGKRLKTCQGEVWQQSQPWPEPSIEAQRLTQRHKIVVHMINSGKREISILFFLSNLYFQITKWLIQSRPSVEGALIDDEGWKFWGLTTRH